MPSVRQGWKEFQVRNGLVPDGKPGKGTLKAVVAIEHEYRMSTGIRRPIKVETLKAERVGPTLNTDTAMYAPMFQPIEKSEITVIRTYSWGGLPIRKGISRDPRDVEAAFAEKVDELMGLMRVAGHRPMVWEAYRTTARAAQLAKRGTGIAKSMHCYGVAVDILDEDMMWKATPAFWKCLRKSAEGLGLVVLYKTRKGKRVPFDMPHVQALEVKQQARFRRMSNMQRYDFINKRLA